VPVVGHDAPAEQAHAVLRDRLGEHFLEGGVVGAASSKIRRRPTVRLSTW
jgi:hypothetical protein